MKTIFRNTENKTDEPHNLFPNLLQRLDLRSSKKNVAFQSLFVYYTLKNIRQQWKKKINKVKIIAPTWNDEFEWITRWFAFSLRYWRLHRVYHKKHETFSTSRPVHIFINRTISRLAFKIKDGFKLELQAPE